MKKFLALAACAMAMTIPAWADEPASSCQVTMTVSDAYDTTGTVKADKITADVSLADGVYTIDNFLGTGQPLCFTLPEDPENLRYIYGGVGFTGDTLVDDGDGYFYMANPADENDSLEFNLYNYNGADLTLYWPGIYPEYSSYYHRTEEGKKPWYITIDMDACDADGEWYYLDVTFWMPELVEPTPEPATVIDFAEALMGSMPSNEEPIDLEEYELGAGYLNIAFGGELALAEGSEAPVTISYNGEEVASVTLKEDNLVVLGNDDAGTLSEGDDDVDPGMTAGVTYTMVELDFNMALTEAGEYTVAFPEGILAYANGDILGAGTVTYTIEKAEEPVVEGDTEAYVSEYDWTNGEWAYYESYYCDATVNEDGSVTVTNFLNSGADLTFTFDIEKLAAINDETVFTSANGNTSSFYIKDADGKNLSFTLTKEDGTKVSFQNAYLYLDDSYVTRVDEYGYNAWVDFTTYAKTEDGADAYPYVGLYLNLVYPETPEVVVVPETTGNTEAWIETPYTEGNSFYSYNMDVIYNEDGSITTTNFMYSGADVTLTFDAAALRDSKKGYVGFKSINGSTDKYPYLLNANGKYVTAYAYNENGTKETIEYPFFYNSSSYSYIGLYSEEEAAEYGHNAYISLMVGGYVGDDYSDDYEVYFDIDVTLPAKPVTFADVFLGSDPSNEEPIDLEDKPLGAGNLALAFAGELALNETVNEPVTITHNREVVGSITLTEDNIIIWGNDDAGEFADDDVDPGMTVGSVTTVVALDFDKALTEAGKYTLAIPEGLLVFADGNLLGAGKVTYTIEEPIVTPEPVVIDFAEALMGSMPSNEEPIDLEEYELGAGYLNIAFGGELALAEGAEAPVTISYNGEEVASVTLKEDNLVVLGNDDAGEYSEGDDDVDPGMTARVVYTMVELDFNMALTEAGEYTVAFPEGILAYANGDILGAGTVNYTIEAKTPVVVVPETTGNTIAWIETPWSSGEYYGYYTDVTSDERGNYTTTNFMYSGASVTVTFDVDELKNSKDGYVGFTSINGNDEEYPFLLDAEGNNVDCYAYNVDGTMATIESPYFFNWDDYSYVELYSEEEAAEYGYNAYICFLIRGWTPEGKSSDYYEVWFDVNIDLTETGIQSVTIGGDAEYYDLQGVRVANPEKGIYIMRQGNKTVKVAK